LSAKSVITRVVTVAAGRFAPGHLGELTRIVPFEMVDAALAETGAVQARVRDLPLRVVVYLLLAAALFAEIGYGQVWARMIAGLEGLAVHCRRRMAAIRFRCASRGQWASRSGRRRPSSATHRVVTILWTRRSTWPRAAATAPGW